VTATIEWIKVYGTTQGEDRMAVIEASDLYVTAPLDGGDVWLGYLIAPSGVTQPITVEWFGEWIIKAELDGDRTPSGWLMSFTTGPDNQPALRVLAPMGTKPHSPA
jgi:hypothetical protein